MSFIRAKAALSESRFADLRWVEGTGSTNADVHDLLATEAAARPGEIVDLVLVADHQSSGRGRLDRTWETPPGVSLLMTVGTTRHVEDDLRGLVLTAMSLAAVEAMAQVAGFTSRIKWPNDLVAVGVGDDGGDRKLGGVLAEASPLADGRVGLAVGIGVNCNWGGIPESLAGIATSLDLQVGHEVDREDLAVAIVEGFARRLDLLSTTDGAAAVVDEARSHSATVGRDIEVHLPHGEIEGRAVGIDDDGALLVEVGESAQVRRVVVGDVLHVRPSS